MNKIVSVIGYLIAVAAGVMLALGLAQTTANQHGIDYQVSQTGALLFGLLGALLLSVWVQTATGWRRPKPKPLVRITVNSWWYRVLILAGAQRAQR